MKRTLSQERYLDTELSLIKTKPHITHLKLPKECRYRVVTVAAPFRVSYPDLEHDLALAFSSAENLGVTKSSLGRYIVEIFSRNLGCGVALCHRLDPFDRKRGRIIAKGRLLKLERRLRCI